MCNANDSIISKVEELMELRKMIEELQNEAEIITDDEGEDWMLYHGYLSANPEHRILFLDRIVWENGWPAFQGAEPSSSSEIPCFE